MDPGPGLSQGLAEFPPEPGEWDSIGDQLTSNYGDQDQANANEQLLEFIREEGNIAGDQLTSNGDDTYTENQNEDVLVYFRERLDVLSVDHDKNFVNQEQGCYADKGNMELDIPDTKDDSGWFQKRSILDVVHIRSGTGGRMLINAVARDVCATDPTETMFYWRYLLLRTNPFYSSYPVDLICEGHQKENYQNIRNILRHLPGQEKSHLVKDKHPSLLFEAYPPMTGDEFTEVGKLGTVGSAADFHEFYFTCNDSCVNCSMAHMFQSKSAKTLKHAARNLRLVITLEKKTPDGMEVIARRSEFVWPKAQICARDLEKTERR